MSTTAQAAVDWNQGVENAWSDVATFIPKLAAFLLILVVGYLVAKAVAKVLDKVLERVGFDRAVERGGVRQALSTSRYDASDLVSKVVFYGLMLLVLQMAFGVFGPNPVNDLLTDVVAYLPKVVAAIVIIVLAAAIAAGVKDVVSNALGGLSYGKALGTGAAASILTIGAFAALSQLEIAPMIVNGLFYGLLAVVVGSAVIAIGGGGIQPMRQRWEKALMKYDAEKPRIQQEMQAGRMQEQPGQVAGEGSAALTSSTTEMPVRTAPSDAPRL